MSALSDRIAEVLQKHQPSATRFCAGCDWDGDVVRNDFDEAIGYRHGSYLDHEAHVAERVAALPIVLIDTDDDADPFYAYQEEMTHKAAADRITYGQWIRRELEGRIAEEERKAYLDGFNDGRYGD